MLIFLLVLTKYAFLTPKNIEWIIDLLVPAKKWVNLGKWDWNHCSEFKWVNFNFHMLVFIFY